MEEVDEEKGKEEEKEEEEDEDDVSTLCFICLSTLCISVPTLEDSGKDSLGAGLVSVYFDVSI